MAQKDSSSANASGAKRWRSFPVEIYADPALLTTTAVRNDLYQAMSFWEDRAGKKLFDFRGAWGGQNPPYTGSATSPSAVLGNVIFFQNPWSFGSNVAGETVVISLSNKITNAIVMINPNMNVCYGTCTGASNATSDVKVITHELGHFLGLQHSSDTKNIMYPTIQAGASLSGVTIDSDAFQTLTN